MQKKNTRALYEYWNTLRGSRSAPDRRNIDPTKIKSTLANTFILETTNTDRQDAEDFSFRLAGSHLCTSFCRELKGRSFSQLWHVKDRDAIDTLIHAVTEDHAVALVTFQGTTAVGTQAAFETILLPLRHNGSTNARILGAMTVIDEPYWLGVQPIIEQRITGLRLIWPDDHSMQQEAQDLSAMVRNDLVAAAGAGENLTPTPLPAQVHGMSARRYAHLAVIDGGRIN